MDTQARQFVAKRCLQIERKLTIRLEREIAKLARMIATTVKELATKEEVLSLQKQVEDLKSS